MSKRQLFGAMTALILASSACKSDEPEPSRDLAASAGGMTPDRNDLADGAGTGPATYLVLVGLSEALVFEPPELTIKAGDTVQWEWFSDGHSVVSGQRGAADGKFCAPSNASCASAPSLDTGTKYQFTFVQAGTFPYFCIPHLMDGMTGTITVQP